MHISLLVRPYSALLRLRRDTSGAVTVEFVVIFPVILLMLALIAFISLLIEAQSEVQQVAFELARFGMILATDPGWEGDICATLAADYLPQLIENSFSLSAANFLPLDACPSQPAANGVLTIAVTYDLAGSAVSSFGDMLGVRIGEITRMAAVIIE